jgi:DnaJ-domain-containing protein 1
MALERNQKTQRGAFRAPPPSGRPCEHAGCVEPGDYRAPRGPSDLQHYRWLCLAHVREFNRAWDYFAGWNQAEIERFQREAVTGHRPTWPLGKRPPRSDETLDTLRDAFRRFARDWVDERAAGAAGAAKGRAGRGPGNANGAGTTGANGFAGAPEHLNEALAVFGFSAPVELPALKQRYKELVKLHHPDANGGNRESEELLKLINRAYTYLRQTRI